MYQTVKQMILFIHIIVIGRMFTDEKINHLKENRGGPGRA